jgi:hypothetical protein
MSMDNRISTGFLVLILTQAAHSVEEYVFRLYDVLAPARFISSLFSDDLRAGFAMFNVGVLVLGLWCYLARVRPMHPAARQCVWLWVVVEAANGTAHLVMAIAAGAYAPGVATAPVLLVTAVWLAMLLRTGDLT